MEKYSQSHLREIHEKPFIQHCGVDSYPIRKREPRKSVRKEMACSDWKIN